jgi:hypothetical protein
VKHGHCRGWKRIEAPAINEQLCENKHHASKEAALARLLVVAAGVGNRTEILEARREKKPISTSKRITTIRLTVRIGRGDHGRYAVITKPHSVHELSHHTLRGHMAWKQTSLVERLTNTSETAKTAIKTTPVE